MKKNIIGIAILVLFFFPICNSYSASNVNRISIGAGPQGASYYGWGAAWSNIMQKKIAGSSFSVEATGGPSDNIKLIQSGDIDFGWATTWLAGEAYNGKGWADKKYDKIRAIFPMYFSVLYIYTLEKNNINSISELEGKLVCTGNSGSTSDLAGNGVLKALKIHPKSISPISTNIGVNNLKDGLVDVNIGVSGVPAPFLLDLETTHEIKFIPLTTMEIRTIKKKYPYWSLGTLKKETYKHLQSDFKCIQFWNIALASKDLPDDYVYKIVKATFEARDQMVASNASAKNLIMDNILYSSVPLHPGALRYYQEMGVNIPNNLIPSEN
ncbi:TAXI family TRAP transporter solute-binding subunit [Desulfotignum balticum]|uniref:TAXI family TRAP transporter solute-binding subunit n=1 Tax=Desulfotignum balticum TaxID=115781 RepID=UPI0003F802BB|nr:TAXI family TRAP transporter solute-binding subunit [Desulfotignum balticum]